MAVFAKIGNDIRKANNASLKRIGHNRFAICKIGVATLHTAVKFFKALHRNGEVFLTLNFSVVRSNTVERLQADVEGIDAIQYAHRLQIVEEITPRVLVVKLAKIGFSRVSEGRMSKIVTESNGFNQVKIETQSGTNGARNAGYELNVQTATGDIIVFIEREHLRFVGIAIIKGAVQDLIYIVNKGRAPNGGNIFCQINSSLYLPVIKSHRRKSCALSCLLNLFCNFTGKDFKLWHNATSFLKNLFHPKASGVTYYYIILSPVL